MHRDLKPANFLLGTNKNSHIIYLIDFGLSKSFINSKDEHVAYKDNINLVGTARYLILFYNFIDMLV